MNIGKWCLDWKGNASLERIDVTARTLKRRREKENVALIKVQFAEPNGWERKPQKRSLSRILERERSSRRCYSKNDWRGLKNGITYQNETGTS